MLETAVHERLKRQRIARKEELAAIALRIGVKESLLAAIEDGRFADLPHGIYGRAAIRSFSAALALDPDAVLADCAALLPPIDDPIDAMARLRGLRTSKPATPSDCRDADAVVFAEPATWRPIAAAAIDAAIIMTLLLTLAALTMIFCGAPMAAFGASSALAFGLMGLVLAGGYFVCFGGIAPATIGERLVQQPPVSGGAGGRDLACVVARALRCALRDASYITHLGTLVGHSSFAWPTHIRSHFM